MVLNRAPVVRQGERFAEYKSRVSYPSVYMLAEKVKLGHEINSLRGDSNGFHRLLPRVIARSAGANPAKAVATNTLAKIICKLPL